jgi:acetyl esterase/lipase
MAYDQLIPLWPATCVHNQNPDELMAHRGPAVRYFKAPERRPPPQPRAAILICPGGGYGLRACHEGDPLAYLFNTHGIDAFVLDYRVKPNPYPAAYSDACRALRLIRSQAASMHIDPQRLGLMGFSAGGHLAALVASQPELHLDEHDDLAASVSARPDRVILGYPVISANPAIAHAGSFINLLGQGHESTEQGRALRQTLSNELHITPSAPPAFVFHTASDTGVPPQNALHYALACANAGVKCELHLFEQGSHGLGMALTHPTLRPWTQLLMTWLEEWVQPLN